MHAHIQFNPDGTAKFELDGQDITRHVLASGFRVEFTDDQQPRQAVISMRLRPDTVTVEGEVQDPPEAIELLLTKVLPEGGEVL